MQARYVAAEMKAGYRIAAFIVCLLFFTHYAYAQNTQSLPMNDSAHQFTFMTLDDQPLLLADLKGKTLLIVNTASQCGFTGQYEGLQALQDRYGERGLQVIGVPSNDFGNQEPGSAEDIADFTSNKYDITFPLTQKYNVKGDKAHPFYAWAADQDTGAWIFNKPRWNFHKYLVSPDGQLVESFGSQVSPLSDKMIKAIEANLPGS